MTDRDGEGKRQEDGEGRRLEKRGRKHKKGGGGGEGGPEMNTFSWRPISLSGKDRGQGV